MSAATAAVPARENKCVCSYYSSWNLLPASQLSPSLPWVHRTEQCGQCEQQDNWHHKQDHQYIVLFAKKKKKKNCHIIIALKIILHIKTAKA